MAKGHGHPLVSYNVFTIDLILCKLIGPLFPLLLKINLFDIISCPCGIVCNFNIVI
jgi:hypothetical protein